MLSPAFQDCDIGVYVRFRTSGKVFNVHLFNTNSKTFQSFVRERLFANDADLVAHTEEDMQLIMGQVYVEPNIPESWIVLSILEAHSVEMAVFMLKYIDE